MIQRQTPGGTEYFVLERGDKIPEHDSEKCGACQFVANAQSIVLTRAQRIRAVLSQKDELLCLIGSKNREDFIVNLGLFTRTGWNGHLTHYLFACPVCDTLQVDYAHGYNLALMCENCDGRFMLRSERFFRDAGLPPPPSDWRKMYETWKRYRKYRKHLSAARGSG